MNEDRRAGGNTITFSYVDDGTPSTDLAAIRVTTRSGQTNQDDQTIVSVVD